MACHSFRKKTRDGLKLLETENVNHYVCVVKTVRLLRYYVNHKYLEWDTERSGNSITIRIDSITGTVRGSFDPKPSELQGLLFILMPWTGLECLLALKK